MYWGGGIIMLFMVFTFYWINKDPDKFSLAFNVVYLTFSRTVYIFGMCLTLMPVLMGNGVLIRKIMSLDIFTTMARLTFGAYMIHPIFLNFETLNVMRGKWGEVDTAIIYFLAWLVSSYLASMVFTVCIESSCMNLEKKYLMGGGRKKKRSNELLKTNKDKKAMKFISAINFDDGDTSDRSSSIFTSPDKDSSYLLNSDTDTAVPVFRPNIQGD